MVKYTCFFCEKKVGTEMMGKRVRCPYCGSKVLFKSRVKPTVVAAV